MKKFGEENKILETLTPLEMIYIQKLKRERPNILGRALVGALIGGGLGLLTHRLMSPRIFAPGFREFVGFGMPTVGAGLGLLSGILEQQRIEELLTDPFERKMALLRAVRGVEPFASLAESLGTPLTFLMWQKALGLR